MKNKLKMIIHSLLSFARRIMPQGVMLFYHKCWSTLATLRYREPALNMRIIGVTGTNGKTSTSYFLHKLLSANGEKVGLISTAVIKFGDKEYLNKIHMTMPGRAVIQSLLRQMKNDGCTTVIVETSSEGIKYHRHIGVYYDTLVFTNLTPEHLASHNNSFEEYKETKRSIFKSLMGQPRKEGVKKLILANADDEHGADFLLCDADEHISFGIKNGDKRASAVHVGKDGTHFTYNETEMVVPIGEFNVYNALPGIIIAEKEGAALNTIASALKSVECVPGRMEYIQREPFTVIVDYAHEPVGIKKAIEAARESTEGGGRVIAVVGGIGGGRDIRSRLGVGTEAARGADIVVVTPVDPYNESPEKLNADVKGSAEKEGKILNKNLFVHIDRRAAIHHALTLAQKGDIVLVMGKGVESIYITRGGAVPWDERMIVREECERVLNSRSTAQKTH